MRKNNYKKFLLTAALSLLLICSAAGCNESNTPSEASGMTDTETTVSSKALESSEASQSPQAAESTVSEENTESPQAVEQSVGEDGPNEHGRLRVENGKLTDEHDLPFQLRGMSTHGIGWFPNYINAGAMSSIKSAGGNVMRVAMYTEADSGYLSEPESNMNMVLQAIENARAMNVYVIVDWHILDDGDPNAHLDSAITFFDAIASSYPNDPAILYEVCNEPNDVEWSSVTQYAYAICPVIRQYSPDAVIILGTPDFSSRIDKPQNEPFPRDNILYSYHYYAGEHKDFSLLKSAVDSGLPVMVSEWGIGKRSDGAAALEEGKKFADYLNENGISWCAWSLCNKDEVYSVLRPDCKKLSGWEESDLTEVGSIMFEKMEGAPK